VSDWDIFPTVEGPLSNAKTRITVRPPSVPAEARPVLDYIAKSESPGYNYMYGGGRFEELNDHPRRNIPIQSGPNVGRTSSAAGRYQFLQGTWDEQAKKLGLTDFSPESQDAAAWDLASTTYRTKTGRDLLTDVKAGNTRDIGPALSGVWTSLPGGIEPNRQTAQFGGGRSPMGAPQQDQQPQAMGFAPEQQRQFPPQSPQSPLSGVTASQAATGSWDAFPAAPQAAPPQAAPAPSQSQAAAPESSQLRAALEGLRSGMTFNFGDEIAGVGAASGLPGVARAVVPPGMNEIIGLARLGYEYLSGQQGGATSSYKTARDEVRGAQQAAQKDHPGTYLGTNILGAVAMPIGGIANAATLPARIGRGAVVGSGMGALSGAGEGEDLASRAVGAGTGGLAGLGLGAAAPVALRGLESIGRGVAAAASPVTNRIRGAINPERQAARTIAETIERDAKLGGVELSRAEFDAARLAGAPASVAELGGETTRGIARWAANISPEARATIQKLADDRFEGQADRAITFLRNISGASGDTTVLRESLKGLARIENAPAYKRAYSQPAARAMWDEGFEQLSQAPVVQNAIRAASITGANRGTIEGLPRIRSPFVVDKQTGQLNLRVDEQGNRVLPNLEFWDHVKRGLDKIDTPEARALNSALKQHLDDLVPAYKDARAGAAKFFGAEDAIDAGQKFVHDNMALGAASAALSKMSPVERDLFKIGFTSKLIDDIANTRDRVNVFNKIAATPNAKTKLQMVLGPNGYRQVEALVSVEQSMDKLRSAVGGNSTSVRQWVELGLAGGIGGSGIVSADPTQMGIAAAIAGRRYVDQRIARNVAEMLVSSDPNVLAKGIKAVAGNKNLLAAFRNLDIKLSRVGAQQGENVLPIQSLMPGRAED
jgi:muramidase (phage lysozyme)